MSAAVTLHSLDDVWPGSPQSAVFRVVSGDEPSAVRSACDEAKAIGFAVKTRVRTVQVAPGVWHVELRVRRKEATA